MSGLLSMIGMQTELDYPEECWNEMQKHQPFGWLKDKSGNKLIIENVDSRGYVEVYNGGCMFF